MGYRILRFWMDLQWWVVVATHFMDYRIPFGLPMSVHYVVVATHFMGYRIVIPAKLKPILVVVATHFMGYRI
jgi:hypothetical protein